MGLEQRISWGTKNLLDAELRLNQCIFILGPDITQKRYEQLKRWIKKGEIKHETRRVEEVNHNACGNV
jgi:glycerol-3-phosphate cytidylyltransferase-like family protein